MTEVAASSMDNSHISGHTKMGILLDVPLLDTIYFTVDLNKHKVLVCSPILCLFKLHMCALTLHIAVLYFFVSGMGNIAQGGDPL